MMKTWLTDEHENQMLYLLGRGGKGKGIDIVETTFVPLLIRVYKGSDRYLGQEYSINLQQSQMLERIIGWLWS